MSYPIPSVDPENVNPDLPEETEEVEDTADAVEHELTTIGDNNTAHEDE